MPSILAKDRKKNMAFARAYILKHDVSNRQAERDTGLGKHWFRTARADLGLENKFKRPEPGLLDGFSWQAKGLTMPLSKMIEVF